MRSVGTLNGVESIQVGSGSVQGRPVRVHLTEIGGNMQNASLASVA